MIVEWQAMTYEDKYSNVEEYLTLIGVKHNAHDVARVMLEIESVFLKDDIPF